MKRIRIFPEIHVFPTPTALRREAQACGERATLGGGVFDLFLPQRGCVNPRRQGGRNPVGVVAVLRASPKVALPTAQPWAGGRNPVGILRPAILNGGAK